MQVDVLGRRRDEASASSLLTRGEKEKARSSNSSSSINSGVSKKRGAATVAAADNGDYDELEEFTARYATFAPPHYPLDAPVPAFALASHGLHFDSKARALKCAACDFSTADLYDDMLTSVLNKHLRHAAATDSTCELARRSLASLIDDFSLSSLSSSYDSNAGDAAGLLNNDDNNNKLSPARVALNRQFASEEARVNSFDNEKLLIGIDKLAANGLYRVPRPDTPHMLHSSSSVQSNNTGTHTHSLISPFFGSKPRSNYKSCY